MTTFSERLPRLRFRHIFIRFKKDLEQLYYDDFFQVSLPIVRVAIILAIILFATFGVLDYWIVPITKKYMWFIRYFIVCPFFLIVFLFSFTPYFKKFMQISTSLVALIGGFSIAIMIGIAQPSELGSKFYYAGLTLVIMWTYVLARLHFVYATIVAWLITGSYEIIVINFNKMLANSADIPVFINNNFFFLSANIIGMFACFTIEYYLRKDFLLRTEIRKTNSLNQKYLINIQEGLILIDHDYIILDQHSEYMTTLFKSDTINGSNFIDFIFPDEIKQKKERKELEKFLSVLFNNKQADLDMIMSINPLSNKKLIINNGENVEEIIIDTNFTRIYNKDNVELVMVIFENKTDIIKYQTELKNQENRHLSEIESISAILKMGPVSFINFINELRESLKKIESKLYQLTEPDVLNILYREIHTLKGSAKYLGLNRISNLCHEIESIFDEVKELNDNKETSSMIITSMKKLKINLLDELTNLGKLIERFQQFSKLSVETNNTGNLLSLNNFFESLKEMTKNISDELDKDITLNIKNSLKTLPHLDALQKSIIHLIRNTLDHGIEDQYERLASNKEKTGNVIIELFKKDKTYNIIIEDDGRGIDFKKIKQKAIEKKIFDHNDTVSRSQLLNVIFTPNFSSKDTASDISGRGYGLDIVKDTIEKLKGKISITTKEKQGTKIILRIPE